MKNYKKYYSEIINEIKKEGLFKTERIISTPQGVEINTEGGKQVLNFCTNNYLGLANHPNLLHSAEKALKDFGFGMASVRFICGTQILHKKLEEKISTFFSTDDTILYSSCFDANGGLFETILNENDTIISDSLNHASIIDGIRLCKANRLRYQNSDMNDLEKKLKSSQQHGIVMIATDGVFSMDGHIAKLSQITKLAKKYKALIMVDDSHATGFIGETGRGSAEYHGVMNQIDIYTSTLGKALGGASGGFTTGKKEIIELLRQRSRPYLFSNTLAPSIVAAGITAFDMISSENKLRDQLEKNTNYFRKKILEMGFDIIKGIHPIVPIMLYEAPIAQKMSELLLKEGIYVIGFYYPVVPKGKARIRVQISAAMTKEHLDQAIFAFKKVGKFLKII